MKKQLISALLILGFVTGSAACSKYSSSGNSESVSGTVKLAGSTSMQKLCDALADGFMATNHEIAVTVEYTGSSAGLEALAAGSVDIGNSSRPLKANEKSGGLVENIVAIDGIAVISNKANLVNDITTEQLVKIYTGEIKNWQELGGKNEQIIVLGREAGSGTRDAFEEILKIKNNCKYAQEPDSTGAVLAKVAATPGAIGYVSLNVVDNTVTCLKLNGVSATEKEILAGKYKLQRPFVMATKGEITEQNKMSQAWFKYVQSAAGKEIIKKVGLIIP